MTLFYLKYLNWKFRILLKVKIQQQGNNWFVTILFYTFQHFFLRIYFRMARRIIDGGNKPQPWLRHMGVPPLGQLTMFGNLGDTLYDIFSWGIRGECWAGGDLLTRVRLHRSTSRVWKAREEGIIPKSQKSLQACQRSGERICKSERALTTRLCLLRGEVGNKSEGTPD